MDYKSLLERYVQLIIQEEGYDYTDRAETEEKGTERNGPRFTPEEIDFIKNIKPWEPKA